MSSRLLILWPIFYAILIEPINITWMTVDCTMTHSLKIRCLSSFLESQWWPRESLIYFKVQVKANAERTPPISIRVNTYFCWFFAMNTRQPLWKPVSSKTSTSQCGFHSIFNTNCLVYTKMIFHRYDLLSLHVASTCTKHVFHIRDTFRPLRIKKNFWHSSSK